MQFTHISNTRDKESGNALVYVLIAIVLFAALGFVMGRQADLSEANVVDEEKLSFYSTQLLDYSSQVRSVVDQMSFSGVFPEEITFFLPGDDGYDDETTYKNMYKLYHPAGGGLINYRLSEEIQFDSGSETNPDPGWYIGRFNNVEWTASSDKDVLITAYKITPQVCGAINKIITGSDDIPSLDGDARDYFIYDSTSSPEHLISNGGDHTGNNADLDESDCSKCNEYPALCVSNNKGDVFAFYSIISNR